ncbi:MAG: M17 family peptidase N-terminal domain-containing protein [Thermodesulfobacteriota bacterium]|nr:M17 family peptidase N-terminal domain-containing protein [Thermodesulfobacteriota bacterium]
MKITLSSEPIDDLIHENIVLGLFSDERPPRGYCGHADWRLNGLISKLIAKGKITGSSMERVLIHTNYRIPSPKILLFGLGESTHLDYEKLYHTGYEVSQTLSEMRCDDFALDIPGAGRCSLKVSKMARSLISGLWDYFSDHPEKWSILSPCILGEEGFIDEITLGIHEFKVDGKKGAAVEIFHGKEHRQG